LEFKLNLTRLIDEKHALLYPNREDDTLINKIKDIVYNNIFNWSFRLG